ncbi:MAG TPA: homoserine kinase [Thermoanaerobaculia bacterium]
MKGTATVFAPGSIGNVGPGFDVLGIAVDGIGDEVTIELRDPNGKPRVEVIGRDAAKIPSDPARNASALAAAAWLRRAGSALQPNVRLRKGLPAAGGLGGSASSAVAGALAAALALGETPSNGDLLEVALEVESQLSGRHLDNVAAIVFGGLTLVRSLDPPDVVRLPVDDRWWLALVTPKISIETKTARAILPAASERAVWVQQMANTAALTHALGVGDDDLVRRSLDDRFAEPLRSVWIPRFAEVKRAALEHGGLGCSISGSGPTVFAIAASEKDARRCTDAMRNAFGEVESAIHVGRIAREGARPR